MKRAVTALAAAAVSIGLLGLAPPATAATGCANPEHPIRGYNHLDAAVGARQVTTFELGVFPSKDCGVTSAVAIVSSPRLTYRVVLEQQADDPSAEYDAWTGDLRLDPRRLQNSDAGVWSVRYEVAGESPEALVDPFAEVLRGTRLTLGAQVKKAGTRVTYRGRLERADWNRNRYLGISRSIDVIKIEDAGGYTNAATTTTRRNGRYRTTQPFLGAGRYQAYFSGDPVTSRIYSPVKQINAT